MEKSSVENLSEGKFAYVKNQSDYVFAFKEILCKLGNIPNTAKIS